MIRRACLIGTVAVLLISPALWAQKDDKDKPKQDKQLTPAEEYRAILKEFQAVQQDYIKAIQSAKTQADQQEAFKKAPKPQEYSPRFLDLAKKAPEDPVAIDSLIWIAQNAGFGPVGDEAVGMLVKDHIENAKIGSLFQTQVYSLSPGMEKLARAVLEKNSNKTTQRRACLALAISFKNRRQNDEAEKLFERIVDEFADIDSLVQVVQNNAAGPSGERAIDALLKDHVTSPRFGTALAQLSAARQPSPGVEKLFRAVLEKSDVRDAKGNATFGLAQVLKNQNEIAAALKDADENRVKQYEAYYGAELVKSIRDKDSEALSQEIEKLLEQVVEDYADVRGPRGTLGDAAKPDLFEIRHLAIGKEVPEIEGEDLDGESFRISDYRGKVVVIDFWGHW